MGGEVFAEIDDTDEMSDIGEDLAGDDLMSSLDSGVRHRLRTRLKKSSRGGLQSAIKKLSSFKPKVAARGDLFRPQRHAYDMEIRHHNEWSMCLFADWLARTKSKRTGKRLAASTICTYVSLLKKELSVCYGFAIAGEDAQRLPAVLKQIRDTRPAVRRTRRALRGRHLRKACEAEPLLTQDTADSANYHAAVATAWGCLARGGEISGDTKFDPKKHPSRADVRISGKAPRRRATIFLRPLKKKAAPMKIPIVLAEHDHSGSDACWALIRMLELDWIPHDKRAATPLFRVQGNNGKPRRMRGGEFKERVQLYAECAGQQPQKFGKHSPRAGGASDCPPNPLLLQAKGRWDSEIGRIYRRMTKRAHVAASLAMQREDARDLEEFFPTFTQPAM